MMEYVSTLGGDFCMSCAVDGSKAADNAEEIYLWMDCMTKLLPESPFRDKGKEIMRRMVD